MVLSQHVYYPPGGVFGSSDYHAWLKCGSLMYNNQYLSGKWEVRVLSIGATKPITPPRFIPVRLLLYPQGISFDGLTPGAALLQ